MTYYFIEGFRSDDTSGYFKELTERQYQIGLESCWTNHRLGYGRDHIDPSLVSKSLRLKLPTDVVTFWLEKWG